MALIPIPPVVHLAMLEVDDGRAHDRRFRRSAEPSDGRAGGDDPTTWLEPVTDEQVRTGSERPAAEG